MTRALFNTSALTASLVSLVPASVILAEYQLLNSAGEVVETVSILPRAVCANRPLI